MFNYTPLNRAYENDCSEIVQCLLLQPNIDVNVKCVLIYKCFMQFKIIWINKTLLQIACYKGDFEFVQFLLRKDDIDVNEKTIQIFYIFISFEK